MAISTDAAAADAAKRKAADADAKAQVNADAEAEAVAQRPTGPGQIPTAVPHVPEEVPLPRVAAGHDSPPLVYEPPDPREMDVHRESRRQAAEAGEDTDLPDERIRDPMKGTPEDVSELLGDSAKPSGRMRMASIDGMSRRLQLEWVAGSKAAWFDVPEITVLDLSEIKPPSPDAWPGVPGSRRPSREA